MARWTPVPVAGGAYSDDCLPWASQDTVNYIPVNAEKAGTRSPAMLRCLPGCTAFSVTGSDAPVRGMRNVEGRLLTVSGNALYRIGTDGAAVSLGTIPGVARCSMAHNQVSGGNEVAIGNGQSGYIYNTATDTLAQITDEGFPGAKVFGFVDGYLMFIEPQGRFFGWSDLAAGTSYNTLDRSEAEAQPDRIVTGIESHGEWLVLGERSGEFYRNAGTTTGTFQRIPGTTMEVGCAGTHAVGKVDNSVIWVGNDGTVYRLNGYQPQRISTHAIEQQLSRCNLAQAFVTVFEDRGHKVVYITCPDGKTWGYDVATGEWHRRKSDGLNRWRMNALCRWNGQWMAGDFSNGRIYQLDWAIQHEDGAEMERRRTFPVMHDNQNALTVNALELVFDTGLSEASNPSPAPLIAALTLSGNLPDGANGDSVSYQYTVAGGLLPRTITIAAGALPTGLSMSVAGLVTGSRSDIGSFAWTVQATDADGTTVSLADASETYQLGPWLYGPVTQNGIAGGSQSYYQKAGTLAGLAGSAVVPLPLTMTVLARISVANRAVFMHGSPLASVSFDGGDTWTACSTALDGSLDVYWNGSFYYNKGLRSADGITWSAIPNLSATPDTTIARASDGALVCGHTVGTDRFEVSLDNGATWTVRSTPSAWSMDLTLATDGTRCWMTLDSVRGYYTDDLFATFNAYGNASAEYSPYWGDGVLLVKQTTNRVGRASDGVTLTNVLTVPTGARQNPTVCYATGSEWGVVEVIPGVPVQGVLHHSIDAGLTFASAGTMYGNGANLAYVKGTP